MGAPTERLARCGCGAYGRVIELDSKRPSSRTYSFTLETENGDRHEVGVRYDRDERAYKMEHRA